MRLLYARFNSIPPAPAAIAARVADSYAARMSSISYSSSAFGSSLETTSATGEGASIGSWENAELPSAPQWPIPASRRQPLSFAVLARDDHAGVQFFASGDLSYGQSESFTEASSVTRIPTPPSIRDR